MRHVSCARMFLGVALLAVAASALFAQTTAPGLAKELAVTWDRAATDILDVAEAMPEEKYDFKPVPEVATFREQLGDIYTAPGLVPAVHGAVIVLLSLWLGVRAIRRGALAADARASLPRPAGYSNTRLALAALLCLVFAAGLIGRVPFAVAAAIFVTGFILLFEWRRGMAAGQRLKRAAIAVAIGGGTGIAVMLVFERLFLVRLP